MAEFDDGAVDAFWRGVQSEAMKALLVTSADGVTLRTYPGDGAEDGDVALPAPLVQSVVSLSDKMRLGKLESLVASYDQLVLVVVSAPPLAATIVASEQADVAALLALRPDLVAALRSER